MLSFVSIDTRHYYSPGRGYPYKKGFANALKFIEPENRYG